MQIEKQFGEKELAVKPERPKNNSVVELALKGVDGIFEENVLRVDVVGNVFLKQRRKILFERLNHSIESFHHALPNS